MSESTPTKQLTQKEKFQAIAERAKKKVGELAAQTFEMEKTTKRVQRALQNTELENQEMAILLRSQNDQVVRHTSVGHKAGVDVTGMALAIGVDLAVFEALTAVGAKVSWIQANRKWLSGAGHLILGVPGYAATLVKRAGNPGFPSLAIEVAEEGCKHMMVLGITNMAKQYLTA